MEMIYFPNTFIQNDLSEVVHVRLRGMIVEIMLEADQKYYCSYVYQNKKEEKVLLIILTKELYDIIQVTLLFHRKVTMELVSQGFRINKYDP